ncbi:MAG: hypothetical protein JJ891_06860 [Rhizobiaceae bacterium]|nr:hypothetical protein [Rhizobiaceae bacterium]
MELRTQSVPSIVQGISQQADQSRGLSSAEDQENCLNSVADGVVARMGSRVLSNHTPSLSDPFFHEIFRSKGEHYVLVIQDGKIRVFNLASGAEATVTGAEDVYLDLGVGEKDRNNFVAVTVEDTTFIANKQTIMLMDTERTPERENKAIAYFKSSGYKTKYTLEITTGGKTYSTTFETPNNSTAENEKFIKTNTLAKEFLDSLDGTVFPEMVADGVTGFTATLENGGTEAGSVIIIDGDENEFDISTIDDQNGTQFIAFKDSVRKFTDLPRKCISGYVVKVAGEADDVDDDYYLKYEGSPTTGNWVETVAPDIEYKLNADTMPHVLVNTNLNEFEFKKGTWGERIAGDGQDTSVDPTFIGEKIVSMNFIDGRLAIITKLGADLSRAKNAYVFFPDTAQTRLDTDPILIEATNGTVTIVQGSVVVAKKLVLWANKIQVPIDTDGEPLREDTVDTTPETFYDYDGVLEPVSLRGSSIVFATEVGNSTQITEVIYQGRNPAGELILNAHCKYLLDGEVRRIAPGQSSGMMVCQMSPEPNNLYVYQYYNNGEERVQSAWNRWTMPLPEEVLWSSIVNGRMYLAIGWMGGFTFEVLELDKRGSETTQRFPLRLDHKIDESYITDELDGYPVVSLPYSVPPAKQHHVSCYMSRDLDDHHRRGKEVELEWIDNDTVIVKDMSDTLQFHLGVIPKAYRDESRLFIRTEEGVILADRLQVHKFWVSHTDTGTYKIILRYGNGEEVTHDFTGRTQGDPSILNNEVPIKTGNFSISVNSSADDVSIRKLNDSVLPSQWQNTEYNYNITKRASKR